MKSRISFTLMGLSLLIAIFATLGILLVNPVVVAISDQKSWASPELLSKHVEALAAIAPPRNFKNMESLEKAATYIEQQLHETGAKVESQTFEAVGRDYRNLIVRLGPREGSRIVVGAHYDVAGDSNPGADDNASGVAGLIELARQLKLNEGRLTTPVELVAFCLEEPPFFATEEMGSAVHARSLRDADVPVKLMMSLEMLGYFSEAEGSQTYPMTLLSLLYPTRGNFIALVGGVKEWPLMRSVKKAFTTGSEVEVRSINAPSFVRGIDFSDHRNYWAQGWPAIMVTDTAFFRNFEYHKEGDIPSRLDYQKMAKVIEGVYQVVVSL